MLRHYRYSRWDGTQQISPFDPEELLEQLADDLLSDGDLRTAMQRMMQMGYQNRSGDRLMGMQLLLERLRQQRQQQLDRFQLNDMMKQSQEKLDEVLHTERSGIERRLNDARQRTERQPGQPEAGQQGQDGDADGEQADGQQQGGQQPSGQRQPGQAGQRGARGQRGQRGQQAGAQSPGQRAQRGQQGGGQGGEPGDPDAGQAGGEQSGGLDPEQLRRMLENMAAKKQQFLDDLPQDPAGAIKALTDYEFMDPEAQRLFQELLQMLQQQVMQSY